MMETLVAEFGLPIALVIYFIYRDFQRSKDDRSEKQAITGRLQGVEDYQKNKLEGLAVNATAAITKNAEINEELVESNRAMTTAILNRPCMKDSEVNVKVRSGD